MDDRDFHRVRGQVLDLHREGRYQEALQVAAKAREQFPGKGETSYWIACLQCRLDDPEGALRTLQGAVKNGHWWSARWLTQDPDLEPLRDRPLFQEIVAESRRRREEAQAGARPELLILPPENYASKEAFPLLIALHWFGGTVEEFAPYWEPVRKVGFLLAVPQSSQVATEDGFGWNDRERGHREIATHWERLNRLYPIDNERVIIAGASQGGRLAIEIALAGDIFHCHGFIAVVPAIRDPEGLVVRAEKAAKHGLRGWIITGEHDHFRPGAESFCELLQNAGVSCELTVVPGLGHDFPDDFGTRLPAAIGFVLKEE